VGGPYFGVPSCKSESIARQVIRATTASSNKLKKIDTVIYVKTPTITNYV